MFRDLEKAQQVFAGLAAHRSFGANLAYDGQTTSGDGMLVSGSYFPVLGLRPALGRLLAPDDDQTIGEPSVVVLSEPTGARDSTRTRPSSNETLIVNGQPMTIVGVAPRGFDGTTLGSRPKVFVPHHDARADAARTSSGFDNRRSYWAYLFARLQARRRRSSRRQAASTCRITRIINDVEAPLQKGMSEQTMARFKAKQITLADGPRGQSSRARARRARR